jgi:hypothetical protein
MSEHQSPISRAMTAGRGSVLKRAGITHQRRGAVNQSGRPLLARPAGVNERRSLFHPPSRG